MERIYIYALLDENGYFRYIGYSKNPDKRYTSHINESKKFNKTHKNKWIKNMLDRGLKPELYLIDVLFSIEEAKQKEIEYIAHFKEHVKLTNGTNGGDGHTGIVMSEETKRKISLANKGNKWTEEMKENHSRIKKSMMLKHTEETKLKQSISKLGDLNPRRKNMKSVLQYDLNNNFIKEWISGIDAGKELKIDSSNINRCCNNKGYKKAGGFIWKFKEEKEVTNVL